MKLETQLEKLFKIIARLQCTTEHQFDFCMNGTLKFVSLKVAVGGSNRYDWDLHTYLGESLEEKMYSCEVIENWCMHLENIENTVFVSNIPLAEVGIDFEFVLGGDKYRLVGLEKSGRALCEIVAHSSPYLKGALVEFENTRHVTLLDKVA